jgi:hypothetical protein
MEANSAPWPMGRRTQPAYNLQSAVDAEHALIIAHDVVLDAADNRSLEPMADAAKAVLGKQTFHVVADAGYSNGAKAMASCRAFPLRGPGTHMATAPSSSATPSAINRNRTRTSVQTRRR